MIATDVGGVAEVVRDGENGLLVPSGDAGALADAVRRYFSDDALRERLRAHAAASVRAYDRDVVFSRIEQALCGRGAMKPRVLFVSRTRYRLPLDPQLARKWDALEAELDLRVLATGPTAATTASISSPRARRRSTCRCRCTSRASCARSVRR